MRRVERIIGGGLALLVACAVALGVAPEVAFAEEVSYVDANGQPATVDATELAQDDWQWGNGVTTWYVAKEMIKIDERVTVSGAVNLILADDAQLTVKGGIEVAGDNSLTVYAQSTGDDMGELLADAREEDSCAGIGGGGNSGNGSNIAVFGGAVTAHGGWSAAGIGGGGNGDGSTITISGGAVTATGGESGAGIGGGSNASGSGIDISAGIVTAYGSKGAAGIGGGSHGDGSNITISGGTVTATGDELGSGIGGGDSGSGSDITISGGTVTATGGWCGAGIGGGDSGSGSNITISDGTVTATGGFNGAGIGGGMYEAGSNIKITGGYVKAETYSDFENPLGNGFYAEGEADVTITGGCFAQDAGGEVGTIYGIVPEAGYAVMRNAEETTSENYPWRVASYKTGDFVVTGGIANEDYSFGNRDLIIKSEKPMTVSMDSSVETVYGTIVVGDGKPVTAHVTLDGVSIASTSGSAITVNQSSLELTLKGKNRLVTSATSSNGLLAHGDALVINGSGSLAVYGGASGIFCAGDLTIEGGHISVRGGSLDGAINVMGSITIRDGLIELTGGLPTLLFAGKGVTITGGAFADGNAVTASASDASSLGMVYGVKPAEDYAVVANANEGEDDYPVRVYPAKDASFGADVLQSPIEKEYDGDPVTVDAAAFDPKRGEASAVDDLVIEFAVHTGSTHGDSDWTSDAPADAGSYDLRLTIPGKLVDGTWWRSTSITYLGTPNTNDAPVKISPASVLYAVPSDVILKAAVGDVLADVASPEKLDALLGAPTFGTEKNEVPGAWSWADDNVTLDEAGEHALKAVFTLDEAARAGNFDFSEVGGWDAGSASFSVDVTVSVAGSAVDPDPDPDPAPPYTPPSRPTYEPEVPETGGGTVTVAPSRPHAGDEVTVSPKPDEGREVRDVAVTDEGGEPVDVTDNGDGTWSFEQPAGPVTVEVTFGCDGGGHCPGRAFADVDPSAWYHDAVDWAVEAGAMLGYAGTGLFGPDDGLGRAQVATILYRLDGGHDAGPAALPPDVPAGAWCAGPVSWALASGVFSGNADGTFSPDEAISREQVACVLFNRAAAAGEYVSARADLSAFPDADEVSGWARDAVSWAVAEGVFSGAELPDGSRELQPARALTRAEGAALLMNWEQRA